MCADLMVDVSGERRGRRHNGGLALTVIAVAQLMMALDATVVAVALPHIQQALGFSNAGLQWVVTGYALCFGGLVLFGGRLGDVAGRRQTLIAGVGLFTAASLSGGLARSADLLLAARFTQGAAAAVVAPATLALIVTNFEEGRARHRAMNVWAAVSNLGAAAGLIVGGVLTTYASWRWTLFINVPVGVMVVTVAPFVLADSPRRLGRIDFAGALTVTGGVAALIYAMSSAVPASAADHAHWGEAKVIAAFVAGIGLVSVFALVESRVRNPLLAPRILADRNRAAVYALYLVSGASSSVVMYFLTLFFQDVWGWSPIDTGLAFVPWVAASVAASALGPLLAARLRLRTLVVAGPLLGVGGLYWLSHVSASGSYWTEVAGPFLLGGTSFGLLWLPVMDLAMSGVPKQDSGVASSVLNVSLQIGGSLGIAGVGTVVWTTIADLAHHHVTSSAAMRSVLARGFDEAVLLAAGVASLRLLIGLALRPARPPAACAPTHEEDAPIPRASHPAQLGQHRSGRRRGWQ